MGVCIFSKPPYGALALPLLAYGVWRRQWKTTIVAGAVCGAVALLLFAANLAVTGEMNYQGIFKHIHQKAAAAGKTFVLGMEHGNFGPGVDGERALIEAYVKADSF